MFDKSFTMQEETVAESALQPVESAFLKGKLAGAAVRHGFFTRNGGVSSGIYESLNCGNGSDDEKTNVLENRARVAGWFGETSENLVSLYQCHSVDVISVDATMTGERPHADAMVSRTPGLVLGILTADCGPVLFADRENGVIGAAHAGWRGAFTGILEATVDAMLSLGAKRETIYAALGPAISKRNYEVGPEFVARFTDKDPDYAAFFEPSANQGHAMFDLPGFIGMRLERAGIAHEIIDHCTYEDEQRFYSYRRTTHRKEPDYGRQISAIALTRD